MLYCWFTHGTCTSEWAGCAPGHRQPSLLFVSEPFLSLERKRARVSLHPVSPPLPPQPWTTTPLSVCVGRLTGTFGVRGALCCASSVTGPFRPGPCAEGPSVVWSVPGFPAVVGPDSVLLYGDSACWSSAPRNRMDSAAASNAGLQVSGWGCIFCSPCRRFGRNFGGVMGLLR